MSDRLTNLEIEDVLSSIRRLVSQDMRPASSAPPEAEPRAPRLVLTPALRVHPAPTASPQDLPAPARGDELATEPAFPPDIRLDQRAAEIEGLLSDNAQDFEPEIGDVMAPAAVLVWPRNDAKAAESHEHMAQIPPAADPVADTFVPEAPFIDVDSHIEPAQSPVDDVDLDDQDVLIDETLPTLDEATLREIVRDVLREELQGPMGTRVTRNLRRLIRAEVARAMAEQTS